MSKKNRPTHEIRVGLVKAAIWKVKHEKGPFFSVTLCRIYKGEDGWKQSSFFSGRELSTVAEVAGMANAWIEKQKGN
jgi:hypothetical protein